jgi:hypothetical protein
MCRALDRMNEQSQRGGQPELHVGIGVNTGPLLLGTVGAHGRLQCTVIGDTVNAAARIEQLTKTYDARFLVGRASLDRLVDPDRFSMRELDRVAVKGKTKAFEIYEVLDAEVGARRSQKEATRELLDHIVVAYRSRAFEDALELACTGRSASPGDPVFDLYVSRCELFLERPPAPDWAGVEDL